MWEDGHRKFVKTDAVDAIMNALQVEDCVTVVGSFGQGKSFLLQHIAFQLRDKEGYQIIPCRDPKEIQTWYAREKKQIFVVDDIYGERTLLRSKLESWQDHARFIKMILTAGTVKIVASSRLYILNDANSKFKIDVFQNVIDLKTKPLSNMQKQELLKMHIPSIEESAIKSILEISDTDMEDHFPLLCLMYTRYRKSSTLSNTLDIRDFFCNIKHIHEDFLDDLKKHDKKSYKTILLFVLLNGKVCREEFSNDNRFLSQEVKLTDLTKNIAINKCTFYKCLEKLTGTFFIKSRDMFLPMHTSILETLLTFCARVSQQTIIQHLKSSVLFRHSDFTDINSYTSGTLIVVNPENENLFFQRMLTELEKRKIFKVFDQHSMNNILFRQKFVDFIRSESSKNHQLVKRILNTKDEAKMEGTVPMLPIQIASYRGWAVMVEMLVAYVDVNFYGIVGFSALHAACVLGEINTIQVLINSGADVNKTAKIGHVLSVFNRHFGLQLCSPINQFKGLSEKAEMSPIYLAVAYQHTSVVKLLLENGANMHTGDNLIDTDIAPSFIQSLSRNKHCGFHLLLRALKNGDKDTIKILLDNGAKLVINLQCPPLDIPLD